MSVFSLDSDISFVEDNNQLVVLNFETGEYYVVEGICMTILQLIENEVTEKSEIITELEKTYDASVYKIEESFNDAIQALKENKFICEVDKDEE